MRNKRGQFYLIAALIIIVILGSFATLFFSNQKDYSSNIYDLREELNIESEKVLDYGTYNSYNSKKITKLLENFSANYADYKGQGKSLIFVYGNEKEIYQLTYDEANRGTVGLGDRIKLDIKGKKENKERLKINEKSVKVKFSDNLTREVQISEGENFYFILSEKKENETYIAESSGSGDING